MKYILLGILVVCGYTATASCSAFNRHYNFISKTEMVDVPEESPVAINGQLNVTGRYLQNTSGENIILRGQSFGWSTWWPRFWNEDVVQWMKDDFYVDVVRAAVGVEPSNGYIKGNKARQLKLVKKVIDAAIKNGLYVIVDFHAHDIHTREATEFFTEIASTYGQYPNIIYEIYNEPDHESWGDVKKYAVHIIETIRQYDADNVILIGNPKWDQSIRMVADSPITGYSNLMYTVHFYAATHGQWLRNDCEYALKKNIPIFVSECNGTEASGSGHIDYKEWERWFDFMERNSISWINWSISDKRGEICSILYPGQSAKGGWTSAQLTETGNYIRQKFREYRKKEAGK